MVIAYLNSVLTAQQKDFIRWTSDTTQRMMRELEKAVINGDNGIGLPYWAEVCPRTVADITYAFTTLNLGTVQVNSKYSRLIFNIDVFDKDKLLNYREVTKLQNYILRCDRNKYSNGMVKVNGKRMETGLNRPGFMKSAKAEFTFDSKYITKYRNYIHRNLVKSMEIAYEKAKEKGKESKFDKFLTDPVNYVKVANFCLAEYELGLPYNLEYNVSDMRGRAVYNGLKRIGNPISNKDFRALLKVPRNRAVAILLDSTHSTAQLNDIYYFIAELCGSKAKSFQKKVAVGKRYYTTRYLPTIDFTDLGELKDLHELIWLERIYDKLDSLYKSKIAIWDIPLEVDASMSIAQVVGALTNDARLLESTNVIGDELTDPWHIEGVRRLAAKAVGTPTLT